MSILLLQRHRSVLCERQCGAVLSEHHQFVWRHALLCGPSRSVRVSWIQSELGQRGGDFVRCRDKHDTLKTLIYAEIMHFFLIHIYISDSFGGDYVMAYF